MMDDQRNLKYLEASTSSSSNWPGMSCIFNNVSEWEPNELTQTRYGLS